MDRIVGALVTIIACAASARAQGITIPQGYRDWVLISIAEIGGNKNDLRAKLGNAIAIKAFRAGTLPYPDGTIIARLAYRRVASPESQAVLGVEAFVAGPPTNVQFMVKDSKKYAATGGWGFAEFTDGKPTDDAKLKACFGCHVPAKDHDFVFTRYAP